MDLVENFAPDAARHPWEVRRSKLFAGILRSAVADREKVDVLDCGAGDGWFTSQLSQELPNVRSATCWDAHYTADQLARFSHAYPSLLFTKTKPKRVFDLVLALDVLEHVEDDVAFARDLALSLDDDGIMLVSVPAWQALFGRHDTFLHHHRRYRPSQCDRVLEAAGLRVVARGGAFHSLVLPRAVAVLGEKLAAVAGRELPPATDAAWNHGRTFTALVSAALGVDNAISRAAARARINVPGLSHWALCARRT